MSLIHLPSFRRIHPNPTEETRKTFGKLHRKISSNKLKTTSAMDLVGFFHNFYQSMSYFVKRTKRFEVWKHVKKLHNGYGMKQSIIVTLLLHDLNININRNVVFHLQMLSFVLLLQLLTGRLLVSPTSTLHGLP